MGRSDFMDLAPDFKFEQRIKTSRWAEFFFNNLAHLTDKALETRWPMKWILKMSFLVLISFSLTSILEGELGNSQAQAQQKSKRRSRSGRRVFSLGAADITAKITQPQALYLVKRAMFDIEIPKPKHDPKKLIEDSIYLDLFEP